MDGCLIVIKMILIIRRKYLCLELKWSKEHLLNFCSVPWIWVFTYGFVDLVRCAKVMLNFHIVTHKTTPIHRKNIITIIIKRSG